MTVNQSLHGNYNNFDIDGACYCRISMFSGEIQVCGGGGTGDWFKTPDQTENLMACLTEALKLQRLIAELNKEERGENGVPSQNE